MCGILSRKSTEDHERGVFDHIRYEYSRCTSRIVRALNTLGYDGVMITYSRLEYARIFLILRSVNSNNMFEIVTTSLKTNVSKPASNVVFKKF